MSTTTTVTNYNDCFVLYRNTNPQCSLVLSSVIYNCTVSMTEFYVSEEAIVSLIKISLLDTVYRKSS